MKLTRPKEIKKGDKAYIISPSAGIMPFVEKRVCRAKDALTKLGFQVVISDNAAKNNGYVSATIEDRITDIHNAFLDDKCSLIMASIGGNNANQLLKHLDYDLIKRHPKAFVGYSDITVLHLALCSKAHLQTFYGPCFLNQFGEYPEMLGYTLDYFNDAVIERKKLIQVEPSEHCTDEVLDWFKNDDEKKSRKIEKNTGHQWLRNGKAEGWALPATIPSLNHLIGTDYIPEINGAILIIDIPEGKSMFEGMPVSEVDAWFTDLDNAGLLSKINGLVIGKPYKYTKDMAGDLFEVIKRITSTYNFPILYGANLGHVDPIITVPIGSTVYLDSSSSRFDLCL